MNHNYTFYLTALPSFSEGMARVLDLGVTLDDYNDSPSPQQADNIAMRTDWSAVGDDLRAAVQRYESEQPKQQ